MDLSIILTQHKHDGQALGATMACSGHMMQVGVRILVHVIVKGNIQQLDVLASAEQVDSYKISSLKIFKLLIPRAPLPLWQLNR